MVGLTRSSVKKKCPITFVPNSGLLSVGHADDRSRGLRTSVVVLHREHRQRGKHHTAFLPVRELSSESVLKKKTHALLNKISSRDSCARKVSAAFLTLGKSARSSWRKIAVRFVSPSSRLIAAAALSGERAARYTFTFLSRSCLTVSYPMPELPPVTMITYAPAVSAPRGGQG